MRRSAASDAPTEIFQLVLVSSRVRSAASFDRPDVRREDVDQFSLDPITRRRAARMPRECHEADLPHPNRPRGAVVVSLGLRRAAIEDFIDANQSLETIDRRCPGDPRLAPRPDLIQGFLDIGNEFPLLVLGHRPPPSLVARSTEMLGRGPKVKAARARWPRLSGGYPTPGRGGVATDPGPGGRSGFRGGAESAWAVPGRGRHPWTRASPVTPAIRGRSPRPDFVCPEIWWRGWQEGHRSGRGPTAGRPRRFHT